MGTYDVIAQNFDELYHHGIKGQKWGKRNGPPYPLGVSDHSASERKAGWEKSLDSGGAKKKESEISDIRGNKNLKSFHSKNETLIAKSKNGTELRIVENPSKKLASLLARHNKHIAEEQRKTINFSINDREKKVGDLQIYKESDDSINIVWIGIDKKARGNGYAQGVMQAAIQYARDTGHKQVTLEVPGSSPDARHVYEKLGFKAEKILTTPDEDLAWAV